MFCMVFALFADTVDNQIPEIGSACAAARKRFRCKSMCKAVTAECQFEFAGYVGALNNNLSGIFYVTGVLKNHVNVEL